ncbi:SDR family NAD(P)-dependent oxidoreductase, partial [Rhodanobacter sp. A1T4]|uniref:SDR family NAD(P)-dependent oxidoreductase n=1 Tax=Rhodanobacter sp. A1T4 TaxID=2723087 RepID=UPI00161287F3
WVKGLAFDWQRLYGAHRPRRISLPTYPFARERYWVQTSSAQPAIASGLGTVLHPLLHRNTSDVAGLRFSTYLSGDEFFLTNRVLSDVAQLEMARSAIGEVTGEAGRIVLNDAVWVRPMVVGADGLTVHIALYPEEAGDIGFEIYSEGDDGEALVYSQGMVSTDTKETPDASLMHDLATLRPGVSVEQIHTLLLQPAWTPQSATTDGAEASVFAQHRVMLCGLDAVDADSVQAQMPDAVCLVPAADMDLARCYETATAALLEQLQSLGGQRGEYLIQVAVPSEGIGRTLAGLSGMLRTAQLENPRIVGQVISVEAGQDAGQALLENRGRDAQLVRYVDGERQIGSWVEWQPPSEVASPWKAQGVYLITGGAGGLGLIFAREIASQARNVVLILTGRSPLNEGIQENIRQLETLGAVVRYHAVDVTDAAALTQLVRSIPEEFESLDGIIHSAGVLRDSFVIKKTRQQLHEVLSAKVAGTLNLDQASRDMALDCFICFSSLAGAVGNVGQADYAAANAFMDVFAHHRAELVARGQRHGRTLSVNWPLWDEGGMHVDAATRAMLIQQAGVHALATKNGVQALRQALASGLNQMLVVAGDAARIRQVLLGKPQEASVVMPSAMTRDGGAKASQDEQTLPEQALHQKVKRTLAGLVSSLIKVNAEDVDGETVLSEYGFDSVTLTEFCNAINEQYRLELKPMIFFEYPTLDGLADYLVREHHVAIAPRLAATNSVVSAPVAAAVATSTPAFERICSRSRSRSSASLAASIASRSQAINEPIAIIGMSGQFPQARDIDAFWSNLRDGKDCISEIPPERWDWRTWYGDPGRENNKTNITWGGFIDGVDEFDPMFFSISPKEAEMMDPQQRLMMIHVWKALEDAGYAGHALSGSDTAIYVGTGAPGYGALLNRANLWGEAYSSTGGVPSVGPNRISYLLNWHGPSEPVETACSSSLVALRRGVAAIQNGESSIAIVGAVNTILTPEAHISLNKSGMLCEDGRCKTFSSEANGYVRGEGVAMLVLKKLSDAERDGDHIYGLVRGTAENHGGRANSLTAPNQKAQAAVVRKAHLQAGIDPRTVSYIEAHGTGTPLGDPVEINGLKAAFKELYAATGESGVTERHCGLGSVKTNIGHLELAAGVAGVIKVLLQMKHKTLVKSLHSESLNPYIDLNGSPFYVMQEAREWTAMRDAQGQALPRRAGVSSFGFGGVNAHVVLEEYIPSTLSAPVAYGPVVVVVSARNEEQLRQQAQSLLAFLSSQPEASQIELADLAYTLQVGREAMEERLGLVVGSFTELRKKLSAYVAGDTAIEDLHRGQVRRNKEAVTALSTDENMAHTVRNWVEKGNLDKLLDVWIKGYGLDWGVLYGTHKPRRISLPTYPFARERYGMSSGLAARSSVQIAGDLLQVLHPLVQRNSSNLLGPRFSSRFSGSEIFLADHKVLDSQVLPGVAQLEMARFAASEAKDGAGVLHMRDVAWARPIVVGSEGLEVRVSLYPEDSGEIRYEIYTESVDGDVVYGYGVVTGVMEDVTPAPHDLKKLRQQCALKRLDAAQCYAMYEDLGIHYGPGFQGLSELFVGEQLALARITLPTAVQESKGRYVLHPSLLDAALQASIGLQLGTSSGDLKPMLPFVLESLNVRASCTTSMWVVVRRSSGGAPSDVIQKLDIDVCDENGVVCLQFKRLGFKVLKTTPTDDLAQEPISGDVIIHPNIQQVNSSVRQPARLELEIGGMTPVNDSADDIQADIQARADRYFVRFLSNALKLPVHKIDPQAQMEAYGIDSLLVLDLTRALEKPFGPLSKTLFFEYQTLAALSEYFVRHHHAAVMGLVGVSHATTVAAPATESLATGMDKLDFGQIRVRSRYETHSRINKDASREIGEIAIVGLAGRYPQADNLEQFWNNLSRGKDSITEIPAERWDHTLYFDEDRSKPGKTYSKWGGFIDGIDLFDPLFFNISPREAELLDPQERLFLECVYATLEDAGYTRESVAEDSNVGVFVGVMYEEYQLYGAQEQSRGRPIAVPGSAASIANRISYYCNFNGPSLALDTMCSSSLTAIHLACQSLRQGSCAVAVAGGVNLSVHPNKYLMLAQGKFVSGKGRCESFGEGGEGYVPGEGVGAVLLKPLAQAQADGDHIYGVIKASAINHGGKTNGYTVPNPNAQAKLIERALREGGVDARAVSYIEAHGTGTSLGDPIEIAGLSKAFRSWTQDTQFCAIGSAKSNIGHAESAAGIAGVTKVLLQMKHQQLAPSLHSSVLNPNIDFDGTPFVVQQELAAWPRPVWEVNGLKREGPRIAGISSFGAGGANAHIVIEEYVTPVTPQAARGTALIVLSARHEDRLKEQIQRLLAAIMADPDMALADLAYTLQIGREPMDERLALVVDSLDELREKLTAYLAGETAIDELYRGQVKRHKDSFSSLAGDDITATIAETWMAKGKYGKLLDLWVKGLAFDWQRLYGAHRPRRISLPTYPFARERYWIEMSDPQPEIATSEVLHPVLHWNASDAGRQRFSTRLSGKELFLADHVAQVGRVLPDVTHLEIVRSAVSEAIGEEGHIALNEMIWAQPVVVSTDGLTLHIALYPEEGGEIGFEMYSEGEAGEVLVHSQGVVRSESALVPRLTESEARPAELSSSGPIQTLLLRQIWTAPAAAMDVSDTYAQHVVLLCGVDKVDVINLQRQLPGVVCLAPASGGDIAQRFEAAAGVLLEQIQELGRQRGKHLIQVVVPSEGVGQTMAGLGGMLRTAKLENPHIVGQVIGIEPGQDVCQALLENRVLDAQQVCYVHGERRVSSWAELPVAIDVGQPWKAQGVYLITGGAGGLGLIFAREIARQVRNVVLILTGRSALNESIHANILSLETLGAVVRYHAVDVTDGVALTRLVRSIPEEFESLDGIIHSAGVLRDSFIVKKTRKQLNEVLSAKVAGTLHLDEASRDMPLDCFICFSSLAGAFGNIGQADYAAANAFMDAFSHYRGALVTQGLRHGRSLSINWPLWEEGGMRVDAATRQNMTQQTGLIPLRNASGCAALAQALSSGLPQVLVAEGVMNRMKAALLMAAQSNALAVVDPLQIPQTVFHRGTSDQPVQQSSSRPNGEEFFLARENNEAPAVTAQADVGVNKLLREKSIQQFKKIISKGIKLPVDAVEADVSFSEYGIDSVVIMELTNVLREVFAADSVSTTLFFEHQSIDSLVDHFMQTETEALMRWTGLDSAVSLLSTPESDESANATVSATRSQIAPTPTLNSLSALRSKLGRSSRFQMSDGFRGAAPTKVTMLVTQRFEVAIVGLSGRYPGAADVNQFWDNLAAGRNCISEIPPERWDNSRFFDEQKHQPGKTYTKWAGLLDDVYCFDRLFFNITPREAQWISPQERLFMQEVYASVEDAGYTPASLSQSRKIGLFVGVANEHYATGARFWSIANRISYLCDFQGPSMAVDTACSSSLTALHLAIESLRNGDSEVAVAGGVNLIVAPTHIINLSAATMLSSGDKCSSFGVDGDGFVDSEAVGAIVLKPLHRAVADGDHIYGVIKGSAVNSSGKTRGYMVPSPNLQAQVVSDALQKAGVDARHVSYLEAHGTGTSLGDPIEIAGLSKAFRNWTQDKQFCAIGSVKSNIGHSESASGFTGISKVLMQMKHHMLAPSLHASMPNPNIKFADTPFMVQQQLAPWPRPVLELDGNRREFPRIAGISSFGAGGANAHVVIEEYIAPLNTNQAPAQANHGPAMVVLSARNQERLIEQTQRLLAAIAPTRAEADLTLANVAYTLQVGREAMEERLGLLVDSLDDLRLKLIAFATGQGDIDGVYQGQAKRSALSMLSGDEDMALTVQAWAAKGQFGKLLGLWVKGFTFDWNALYSTDDGIRAGAARPRRISLPTYPFAREYYWTDVPYPDLPNAGGATGQSQSFAGYGAVLASKQSVAASSDKATPTISRETVVALHSPNLSDTFDAIDTSHPLVRPAAVVAPAPIMATSSSVDVSTLTINHQQAMVAIWQELFGRASVEIDDDFFELGGDSLLGTQLVSRILAEFGVEITIGVIFESSTVRSLVASIQSLGNSLDTLSRAPNEQPISSAISSATRDSTSMINHQQTMVAIWQELFGRVPVEIDDDFFELGGDSLLGTQLVSRILAEFGVEITIGVIFESSTVRSLVASIQSLGNSLDTLSRAPNEQPISSAISSATRDSTSMINHQQTMVAIWQELFGRVPVEIDDDFFELGGDSLLGIQLVSKIRAEFGVEISVGVIFESSTVKSLVASIQSLGNSLDMASNAPNEQPIPLAIQPASPEAPLSDLPIQYADFAQWQRQWLSGKVLEQQLSYWKQQLADCPSLLTLPTDRPRPARLSHRGAMLSFMLPATLVSALRGLGNETQSTLFMTLYAAFNVLLARYSGQSDICIGTPIANRNRSEVEELVGFFVNTLVLRTQVDQTQDFNTLQQQVRQCALDAYAHQDVPFEQLVEAVQPERHASYTPLFQVMLVLQNTPMDALVLPGLSIQAIDSENVTAKFDLTLTLTENKNGLQGCFEYSTDLFDASTIARLADHLTHLL